MTPEMTPHGHDQQKAWVIASEMLSPTRTQRHGVYRNRKPLPVLVAAPVRVYVLPVVRERQL